MSAFNTLVKYTSNEIKNIAKELDKNLLKQIGERVVSDYRRDEQSRSQWMKRTQDVMKMTLQEKEIKTYPFVGCANIKYPLCTMAALSFASRLYPEIIKDGRVVRTIIYGQDPDGMKQRKAYNTENYMSYQLLCENPEWEPETDKLLHMLPVVGTVFRKVRYDSIAEYPKSELCLPEDIVVNNSITSLKTARRISHKIRVSKNYITEQVRYGYFLDLEDSLVPTTTTNTLTYNLKDVSNLFSKNYAETSDDLADDADYTLVEQHRWLDLDNDGYEEPYIVTCALETGDVLGIYPRFYLEDIKLNEKTGEIKCIAPKCQFVDYHFIPSPDGGFYSLGYGHLLLPINEAVNTLLNNLTDSGSLANLQSGFITRLFKIKEGKISLKMGEYTVIDAPVGTRLSENIFPLPFKEPSAVLFQLLGLLIQAGNQIASINDVLLGEANPQNAPAGSVQELANQGLKVFSAIYKRYYKSAQEEYKYLFELNKRYLTQEKYFNFNDDQFAIAKEDFDDKSIDIMPVADQSLSSDTMRSAQSSALIQLLQTPVGQTLNPIEISKRILETLRITDPEKVIMPPNPNPQPSLEEQKVMLDHQDKMVQAQLLNKELDISAKEVQVKEAKVKLESPAKAAKLYSDAKKNTDDVSDSNRKHNLEERKLDLQAEKNKIEDRKVDVIANKPPRRE